MPRPSAGATRSRTSFASKASPAIADARGREHLGARAAVARLEAQHREVAGAAAEVADQHQLGPLDAQAVVVRGGDRLELEHDLVEAGARERRAQARERESLVGRRGLAREAHRAADDDARAERSELRFRLGAQLRDESPDEILELVDRAEDLRALEERTREERLDRLHEPPVAGRLEIAVDRGGSGAHARRSREIVGIGLEVQDRAERMRVSVAAAADRKRRESWRAAALVDRDRRVRGAEVETDDAHRFASAKCRAPHPARGG